MCFAQPDKQVTPTNPANYPLNENYGQVRSATSDLRDGKTVRNGDQTIADQYQAELTNPNARPRIKADPKYRGGINLKL